MIRWYVRRFRILLYYVAWGAGASVIGALVLQGLFSASSAVTTISCDDPGVQINFPQEAQVVQEIVSVAGSFDCLPKDRGLWITVTPPLGSPHGIHPTSVDGDTFSATAVLASGAGEYRICVALAERNAEQAFQGAIRQDPPIGLPNLPATALIRSCVEVLVEPGVATPTLSPCPSAQATEGFTTLEDRSRILRITVPSAWCDISLEPLVTGDPAIRAALSLGELESRSGPGLEFTASALLTGFGDVEALLDFTRSDVRLGRCTYEGRFDYQRAPYAGKYDQWTSCPGLVTDIVILAAGPSDGSFFALVEIFMATEAERNALEGILNSFEVSNLGGG